MTPSLTPRRCMLVSPRSMANADYPDRAFAQRFFAPDSIANARLSVGLQRGR